MTTRWNVRAAVCLLGICGALSLVATAAAAPPFAPVDTSFEGTRFRGVALGQSRAEVEAALAENGMRCYTTDEITQGGTPPIEMLSGGYSTCRITKNEDVSQLTLQLTMNARLNVEVIFGQPTYAVSFVDDVASSLALAPEYFNVGSMTVRDFAQSIVDNYPLIDGMTPTGKGWSGHSSNGEIVTVQLLDKMVPVTVLVNAARPEDSPTFD